MESYEGGEWLYDDYIRTTITPADVADNCEDGVDTPVVDGYQTSQMTTRMMGWIEQASEPWFAYAAYSAAHTPFHCPPQNYYPGVSFDCDNNLEKYRSMIKALDYDLGRLFEDIDMGETLVIVVSDNGSPTEVAVDPVDAVRAKGTVFQGGVRVPFIIGGPGLQHDTIEGGKPVGVVDLYATILTAAAVDDLPDRCEAPAEITDCTDGVDLSPYFEDDEPVPLPRSILYTEWLYPNFDPDDIRGPGPSLAQQAIRNTEWKYVQMTTGLQGLSHISDTEDPWEDGNMIYSTDSEAVAALAELQGALETLVGEAGILDLCDLTPVGESCDDGADCCSRVCSSGVVPVCVDPWPPHEPGCA